MRTTRLCLRTKNELRKFLWVTGKKDGSIYMNLYHKSKIAKVYSGNIVIPAGKKSQSTNYQAQNKKIINVEKKYCHTGFKSNGDVYTKHDNGYSVFNFPELKHLNRPLLMKKIYPGDLSRFIHLERETTKYFIIPDSVEYIDKKKDDCIENVFGDDPFHIEVLLVSNCFPIEELIHPELSSVKFGVRHITTKNTILFLFCQDKTDIKRGWLEKTSTLTFRNIPD